MNSTLINLDAWKKANQAADELTGIPNLVVIRNAVQQSLGMLTVDMVQVNNYAVIPVKTHGADLTTAQQQKDFVRQFVKGTVYESLYEDMFETPNPRSHEKLILKSPFLVFPEPAMREWFNNNYLLVGVPPWMFLWCKGELADKYNIDWNEEEMGMFQQGAMQNMMGIGQLVNLFMGVTQEKAQAMCRASIKITQELAAIFKANLFYFSSLSTLVDKSMKNDKDDKGIMHVTAEDIGTKLKYNLNLMERTVKNVSLYSWQYEPEIIRSIITRTNPPDAAPFYPTVLTGRVLTYEDIMHFMVLYDAW